MLNACVARLRQIEAFLRHRSHSLADNATRVNRVLFYVFDLVFWSRIVRTQRGPVPVELPPALLRRKGVAVEAPVLHVSGLQDEVAHWDDGFAGVYAALFENLQTPDMLSTVRYAHPGPAFRGVYLWDSAFIAQIWKYWDRTVAHEVAEAVLRLRDGDRLQHVVSDLVASAYTQPPLLAWSLLRIWQGDAAAGERLAPWYAPLSGYQDWLRRHRRLPNGLYFWAHPYESGVENAPRFGSADESVYFDTRKVAAPDLCTYVVLQLEALHSLAEALGRADDAALWAEEADTLKRNMREFLWHEADGLFYDRHVESGAFVCRRTIASLMPLWAGVPTREQARRLCGVMAAEHGFNSLIPLPSVALDDAEFAKDMWRGPVWLNTAYGVIQGLKRYGEEAVASDYAFRLCDAVYRIYRQDRRFYEFYDPLRLDIDELQRKRGNRWKAFTLGSRPQSDFVGWTGLVNTLVIEQLFGFHRHAGCRYVQPRFPTSADGRAYSLRLPSENLAIDVSALGDAKFRVTVRMPGRFHEQHCAFGERVTIDEDEPLHAGIESSERG